ncbi:NUDIX hydrolase [Actinoplanes sp. NPDC048796]|uniref:NUDIX hydrolase n=1 Tax=unclassified Actinoplanes TaxID=2626549 RepID=UPI0033FECB9F
MTSTDYTATLPRKRMGAAALLTDAAGRVLLVEPTYKPYWEIPGGVVEADESPHAAVARELAEELALTLKPGRLLVTDWVPPREGRTEGVMLVFDGGTLTEDQATRIRVPPEELHGWAWSTEREAEERLSGLLARRIVAALRARAAETAVYLENGYVV